MQAEGKFMVYEGDVKFEKYEPTCVRANLYMADIRKEMRSERQVLSDFLTVKEFSKHLKHV